MEVRSMLLSYWQCRYSHGEEVSTRDWRSITCTAIINGWRHTGISGGDLYERIEGVAELFILSLACCNGLFSFHTKR